MRPRIKRKIDGVLLLPTDGRYQGVAVKSFKVAKGVDMPTKAYYDDGATIQNQDDVVRVVLTNGMIHYLRKSECKII